MIVFTKVSLKIPKNMEKGNKLTLIKNIMLEIGNLIKDVAKVLISLMMEAIFKGNGKITKLMAMGAFIRNKIISMLFYKDYGKIVIL
jgi:hypothetical protein